MKKKEPSRAICQVTKKEMPLKDLVPCHLIRAPILELISADLPDLDIEGYVSAHELKRYRHRYLQGLLVNEKGDLTDLEKGVLSNLASKEIISKNIEEETEEKLTFGQRIADRVAQFGGSWTFIIAFFTFILAWISVNIFVLMTRPFDPYPFILLNLILSCLAAIQAPIIMMSQNRQETKDRMRAEHDYQVNLKAELEIRQINEKLDHLLMSQIRSLVETQRIQVDYLDEIMSVLEVYKKRVK